MGNPWHDREGKFTFGPGGVGLSAVAPGDTLKVRSVARKGDSHYRKLRANLLRAERAQARKPVASTIVNASHARSEVIAHEIKIRKRRRW